MDVLAVVALADTALVDVLVGVPVDGSITVLPNVVLVAPLVGVLVSDTVDALVVLLVDVTVGTPVRDTVLVDVIVCELVGESVD